jgi:hypothetical protein
VDRTHQQLSGDRTQAFLLLRLQVPNDPVIQLLLTHLASRIHPNLISQFPIAIDRREGYLLALVSCTCQAPESQKAPARVEGSGVTQTLSSEDLNRRATERRAIEAAIWGYASG